MDSITEVLLAEGLWFASAWVHLQKRRLEAAAWGWGLWSTMVTILAGTVATPWLWETHGWETGSVGSLITIMTGVATGAASVWFARRVWWHPAPYGLLWNEVGYCRALWRVIESGTDEEKWLATQKVEQDIGRIVSWAKDETEGKARKFRGMGRQHPACAIIDLMGDGRWAKAIVQKGGRLAADTMMERLAQEATGIPVGRMLGGVTRYAVETDDSFLQHEEWNQHGSLAITRQQPRTRALYEQGEALEADRGAWLTGWMDWDKVFSEEEEKRWMSAARSAMRGWGTARYRKSPELGFLRNITAGLQRLARADEQRRERRGEGVKGQVAAVQARMQRSERLLQDTCETIGELTEDQMSMLCEAWMDERLKTLWQAAALEAENDDEEECIWYAQHGSWLNIVEGPVLEQGRSVEVKLAGQMREMIRREGEAKLTTGFANVGGEVLNMMLRVRAHRQGHTTKTGGQTKGAVEGDELVRSIIELMQKNLLQRLKVARGSLRKLLDEVVRIENGELVVGPIGQPRRWSEGGEARWALEPAKPTKFGPLKAKGEEE